MADVSLNYGLVGYWPFDEGSGSTNTRDDSGWSNRGALQHMDDSNWTSGKSGTCLHFNGSNEGVFCSDNGSLDITNKLSISAWIYVSSGSSSSSIVAKSYTSNQYSLTYDSTNKRLLGVLDDGLVGNSANNSILEGVWYHVVMVYNQTDVRYYIDGILSGSPHSKTGALSSTSYDIYLGREYTGDYFEGKIDEIRIYNRALNTDEIEFLYSTPSGVNKNLVSARLLITDIDGDGHTITDNIEFLEINNTLSHSSDTFDLIIVNDENEYSYIEHGCKVEILLGTGGVNTKKITGIMTEVSYMLDDELVKGRIEISGEDIKYRLHNIYIFNIIYDKLISQALIDILGTTDVTTGQTIRELADIDSDNTHLQTTTFTSTEIKFIWTSLSTAIQELADYVGYEWYIDTDKKLHFYEPEDIAVSTTITDTDLIGQTQINVYKNVINRSIVVGGFRGIIDQKSNTQNNTYTVTNLLSKESTFVPTNDQLYSVDVWTERVSGSSSNLILTIEDDDDNLIPNSLKTVYSDDITDGGYTTFQFNTYVNLTVDVSHNIHLEGTTSDGVKIGIDSGSIIDYITKYPVRVASVMYESDSVDKYGLCMDVYVNTKIVDQDMAVQKAISMLNGTPKKHAIISVDGYSIEIGDIITLNITKPSININKDMKVVNSTLVLHHSFIENILELDEL